MAVVLVIGMSGAGKSAVLAELAGRGHAVVDTDEGGFCEELTTNPYGRSDVQQAFIAADVAVVEPLLRAGATDEIDARRPLAEVADELERIAAGESAGV